MKRYKFHLAFENECSEDYITEKLWGALSAGTLPIYYGAPNVLQRVPPNSVVDVNEFKSWEALGEYVKMLSKNDTAYYLHHKWRDDFPDDRFLRMYNFTRTHSECRACRYVYARANNLGWDVVNQRHDTHI
jgi:hypothetical protein